MPRGRPKSEITSDVWGSIARALPNPKQGNPGSPISAINYVNHVSAGMQAKKYKGGMAAKAKASSKRLFESYFKPLPQ